MRFMVIVKATKESEAGVMPTAAELSEMGAFNEELIKAGVMLAGDGLHASSKGARVKFKGKERTVIDGPFAETKELVAGYWIWQCKSLDEALAWARKCPCPGPNQTGELELRPLIELSDFPEVPENVRKNEAAFISSHKA